MTAKTAKTIADRIRAARRCAASAREWARAGFPAIASLKRSDAHAIIRNARAT